MFNLLINLYKRSFGSTVKLKSLHLAEDIKSRLDKKFEAHWNFYEGSRKENKFNASRTLGFWTRNCFRPNVEGLIIDKGGWTEVELFIHLGIPKLLFVLLVTFPVLYFCIMGMKRGNGNSYIELIFMLVIMPMFYAGYRNECSIMVDYFSNLLEANIIDVE